MKTTIELAREAAGDDWKLFQDFLPEIHKLAELVRADECNSWPDEITAIKQALAAQPTTEDSSAVQPAPAQPNERDIRNATLDEIATKIDQMPFGDTAASFAVWIREQKV